MDTDYIDLRPILSVKRYGRQMIRDCPNRVFMFGDNLARQGLGGQAKEARGEPNSIGIPTKVNPHTYLSDDMLSVMEDVYADEFRNVKRTLLERKTVIVPEDGIGTGRAKLAEKAPQIHALLQEHIAELHDLGNFLYSVDVRPFCPVGIDIDLAIVGEAPGKDEVEQGYPFVGRAGKLLRSHLRLAGIDPNTVYISNVIKNRPPKNDRMAFFSKEVTHNPKFQGRYPKKEIWDHLRSIPKEMDIIRPRRILALGRTAMWYFMAKDPLTVGEYRGKEILWRGIPVILSWHPAFLLRNMKGKEFHRQFQDDLQKWAA